MQQRRYRPGDVLDDYCPRERRITDHAIVAMIDEREGRPIPVTGAAARPVYDRIYSLTDALNTGR